MNRLTSHIRYEQVSFRSPEPQALARADVRPTTCDGGRYTLRQIFNYRVSVVFLLVLLGTNCTKPSANTSDEGDRVTTSATEGPVTVTLSTASDNIPLNTPFDINLEVIADQGTTVSVADYEKLLRDGDRRFEMRIIESSARDAQPTADGRMRWSMSYRVEFLLPGEYELPPAMVSFMDSAEGEDEAAEQRQAETERLNIRATFIGSSEPDEEELANIPTVAPRELPYKWTTWAWLIGVPVLIAVVVTLWLVRRRRRQSVETVIVIPAHEWAYEQFKRLVGDRLLADNRVQEFYYRVSDVVRGYVERRFHLSAPEMTTEEFLLAASRDSRFAGTHTQAIEEFLTACDIVKYARYKPAHSECEQVLTSARDYVNTTREHHDESQSQDATSQNPKGRAA